MDEITNYDRWKYRRCRETIKKNQCPIDCDVCKFDIELQKYVFIMNELNK